MIDIYIVIKHAIQRLYFEHFTTALWRDLYTMRKPVSCVSLFISVHSHLLSPLQLQVALYPVNNDNFYCLCT